MQRVEATSSTSHFNPVALPLPCLRWSRQRPSWEGALSHRDHLHAWLAQLSLITSPMTRSDKKCITFAEAFGASNNVAFARWADQLSPELKRHCQPVLLGVVSPSCLESE